MPLLIGMDEAGYGPNLGPLVVAAAVLRTPPGISHADCYSVLKGTVSATEPGPVDHRLWIADSKRVYRTGQGLFALERTLGAAFRRLGWAPRTWPELCFLADRRYGGDVPRMPWHRSRVVTLPTSADHWTSTQGFVFTGSSGTVIEFVGLRARVVEPLRFNLLLRRHGNKAQLLSHVTLGLALEAAEAAEPGETIQIWCDRHGGRKAYAHLIQAFVPDTLVQVRNETPTRSVYRTKWRGREFEFAFMTRAEQYLVPALASMFAKYLRELSMLSWNKFWGARIVDLRPTAGYPVDAHRFHREIAEERHLLRLPDSWTWRYR